MRLRHRILSCWGYLMKAIGKVLFSTHFLELRFGDTQLSIIYHGFKYTMEFWLLPGLRLYMSRPIRRKHYKEISLKWLNLELTLTRNPEC